MSVHIKRHNLLESKISDWMVPLVYILLRDFIVLAVEHEEELNHYKIINF